MKFSCRNCCENCFQSCLFDSLFIQVKLPIDFLNSLSQFSLVICSVQHRLLTFFLSIKSCFIQSRSRLFPINKIYLITKWAGHTVPQSLPALAFFPFTYPFNYCQAAYKNNIHSISQSVCPNELKTCSICNLLRGAMQCNCNFFFPYFWCIFLSALGKRRHHDVRNAKLQCNVFFDCSRILLYTALTQYFF